MVSVAAAVAKVHAWMQHQPIEQVIITISLFIVVVCDVVFVFVLL